MDNLIPIEAENQLGFISKWGPDFVIKFGLYITSFGDGSKEYSDVLHFTATDQTCCNEGDRIPGVFLNNQENRILVAMWGSFDGGVGNIYYTSGTVDEKRWYDIEIKQENVRIIFLEQDFIHSISRDNSL